LKVALRDCSGAHDGPNCATTYHVTVVVGTDSGPAVVAVVLATFASFTKRSYCVAPLTADHWNVTELPALTLIGAMRVGGVVGQIVEGADVVNFMHAVESVGQPFVVASMRHSYVVLGLKPPYGSDRPPTFAINVEQPLPAGPR
jgi:hypothetical protein